jgi:hypothetical protein
MASAGIIVTAVAAAVTGAALAGVAAVGVTNTVAPQPKPVTQPLVSYDSR